MKSKRSIQSSCCSIYYQSIPGLDVNAHSEAVNSSHKLFLLDPFHAWRKPNVIDFILILILCLSYDLWMICRTTRLDGWWSTYLSFDDVSESIGIALASIAAEIANRKELWRSVIVVRKTNSRVHFSNGPQKSTQMKDIWLQWRAV